MCAPTQGAMLPYGLKVPSPYFPFGPTGGLTQAQISALDFQRSQLNDYNVRVQLGLRNYQNSLGLSPFHAYITDPYTQAYFYKHDPRARFVQEEPKPSHSYIGLIGMAILNAKEKKLVLSDIYQWILDNYPYFRTRGPGWRNSIRHNLSLNDCFIKAGRSANGKGHYWAVHPANVDDFERGDFRRRRAQRKVRRHMGLSVPDDDDSPTPSPTQPWPHHDMTQDSDRAPLDRMTSSGEHALRPLSARSDSDHLILTHPMPTYPVQVQPKKQSRKRLFDMASLLAPDDIEDDINSSKETHERISNQEIDVSGFNFHPIYELKQQEIKVTSVSDKNKESSDFNEDVNVDMSSSSSMSGKEMDDDSADEDENDEIQVTSEEDSPAHGHGTVCDAGHVQSGSDTHESSAVVKSSTEGKIFTEVDKVSKWPSSPYKIKSKTEKAIDLSSPTQSESEKILDTFYSKSYDCEMAGLNPSDSACDNRQQHHRERTVHGHIKKEIDHEKGNGYEDFKSLNNSYVASKSKTTNQGYKQDRQTDPDGVLGKLSYHDRCEHRELSFVSSRDLEFIKRTANTFHGNSAELQEPCRQQTKDHGDSKFGTMVGRLAEPDRHIQEDKKRHTSEAPVSESCRLPGEQVELAMMPKTILSRDRLSAFSTLGTRNHSIYSPLQLRNFSLGTQRLLSTATPVRAGVPAPLTSVSTPSSSTTISLITGLDSVVSKCSNKIPSINIRSNSTSINGAST